MSLLSIRGVTKKFGGLRALHNCSFSTEGSSIVSLIGPNGAGKTTVFNLISGITPVTSGSISFKGRELVDLKSFEIAELGIGRTFQNTHLFNEASVLDNVRIGSHCRTEAGLLDCLFRTARYKREERYVKEKAEEFLELIGLFPRRNDLAGALSYGDQKRVEIARALMIEPSLLLLDEPNSGMNDYETSGLVELFSRIKESGITLFIISHHMKFVQEISDQVIVLNYGKVIANGTPESIRRKGD
jgi:branched-chain amino acid transport system ATP-binding protein